jgi:type VI secretion system secreted protein VgrG
MSDPILGVRVEATNESLNAQLTRCFVHHIDGKEAISQLFDVEVCLAFRPEDMTNDAGDALPFDLNQLPGAEVAVVLTEQLPGEQPVEVRRIHGIVLDVRDYMNEWEGFSHFRIKVVPRLWNLGRVSQSDVFLGKTVWQILEQVFENYGLEKDKDFVFQNLPSPLYAARDFVMQYQETHLAFLMRLCEEVGVAFHFDHGDGVDKVVFSDTHSIYQKVPGLDGGIPFVGTGKKKGVYRLNRTLGRFPRSVTVEDYNYEAARTLSGFYPPPTEQVAPYAQDALVGVPLDLGWGGCVEFGGNLASERQALALAQIRYEEARTFALSYDGETDNQALFAGGKFEVTDHPGKLPKFLVTRLTFSARYDLFDGGQGEAKRFSCTFAAIAHDRPFRPARVTPKPRIAGFLSATIGSGTDGQIEHGAELDAKGRYRVRFKFDTLAPDDRAQGSHWIRLAQALAGPGYGWSFPLRKGVEVLVAFEGGDPDRPVISGALYHGTAPNPVNAANVTKNRLKTQSGVLFEIDDGSGR